MLSQRVLVVVEDSSKVSFGGGQHITASLLDFILSDRSFEHIFLFDHVNPFASSSLFLKYIRSRYLEQNSFFVAPWLVSFFRVSGNASKSQFSFDIFEVILGPLVSIYNSTVLFFTLFIILLYFRRRVVLYAPTKKAFIESIPCFFLGAKLIFHSHTISSVGYLQSIFTFFLRLFVRNEIAVSKASCQLNTRRSFVLPNYCPNNDFSSFDIINQINFKSSSFESNESKIVFACFSSFKPLKGVDIFIESFSNSGLSGHCEIQLYGTGSPAESRYLNDKASSLGMPDNIFKGYSSSVLSELFNHVHFLVLPSIAAEACPLVLLEAISVGVPVITSRIGGQYELLSPLMSSYSYSPSDDVNALTRALARCASITPSEYVALCYESSRISKKYSYSDYFRALKGFLLS